MADEELIAYSVLGPHFDAVRDEFARHAPAPDAVLARLCSTKLVVTAEAYSEPRHYGRCREDALVIELAPQAAGLDHEQLIAIIAHEFGHAADFAYPASWVLCGVGTSKRYVQWIGSRDDKAARRHRRLWHDRTTDAVEWTADAIAEAVTGLSVTYCGPCMVQCFQGVDRPAGLR